MIFLTWLFGCSDCDKNKSDINELEERLRSSHQRVNKQFEELDTLRARNEALELALKSAVENPTYLTMHLRISNQRREITKLLASQKIRVVREYELLRKYDTLRNWKKRDR